MTLRALQPQAVDALDDAIARGREVVDPDLLDGIEQRILQLVADGPTPRPARDPREADTFAVVEQMLVDVAGLDDETVRRAAAHFADGAFADVVMTSYAIEARTRLTVAADLLLGGIR